MKELEQEKEKLEIAEKNLSRELCKKFKLPMECSKDLEEKIEKYLERYSECSNAVLYVGYDLETNTYYQDQYHWGEKYRFEISKEKAESWGIGSCYDISTAGPEADAPDCFENVDYMIRRAIGTSVKEQLEEGIDIKNVNLFKMKDDYKELSCLEEIYNEKDEPKRERPEWAKKYNVYL